MCSMDTRVRTTVNLPRSLYDESKMAALQRRKTLTSLIEEGLRKVLSTPVQRKNAISKFVGGLKVKPVSGWNENWKREDLYEDYLRKKMSF